MDVCPNEILDLIFSEACVDDGFTGRSLSLVSKRIHDTSRRYTFQSIALYGPHRISSFAHVLDKADLKYHTIRHLYLADRSRFWVEGRPDQDKKRDTPPARIRLLSRPSRPQDRLPIPQMLTLLLFDKYDEQPLSDAISLPRLHELTVHDPSLARIPSPLPRCLSLRRLHVIFALGRPWTAAMSHLAPHLTHLRISGLGSSPLPLMDIVCSLERLPPTAPQDDLASKDAGLVGFPPTLERVLVQLLQNHFHNLDCANQSAQVLLVTPMALHLKNTAMQDVRRRIVLLKPAWMSGNLPELLTGESADVQFYMGLTAAWQRRTEGLESAVWDVERESVLASYGYWAGDQQ
ncbi:hypothetical protein GSI_07573 [Ganoderma sinense ZZ0214-1]|uniref:F-box domain-containing protein n=1 Tax=Ganoderma sinense ZZ0214-1 TaxID=1077348 RepID=A0A2G8S9Y2_9APHY|nr:hypothetical protein GSI_07573 [Ganoderma sinense ZZ0214-1]